MGAGSVILNQPGVYLVDADGNVVSADDGTTISSHEGILVAGKDGTVLRFMRVASDGTLRVDPTGTTAQPITDNGGSLTVDGPLTDTELRATAVPISATTLPLPTGAATETKLEAVRALLSTIDADTSSIAAEDFATQTTLATLATESKLEAVRVLLASLDGKDFATQTTLAAILVDTGQMEALLTTIDADTSQLAASLLNDGDTVSVSTDVLPVGGRESGGTDFHMIQVDSDGRPTVDVERWFNSTAPSVGQKAMASSIPVTVSTDQAEFPVSQGTKGAGSNAWPQALYDASGNAVGVILNNSIYRLETRGALTSADGTDDVGVDNSHLQVVDESYAVARDDIVGADNYRAGLTGAPDYGLAVDLDNAGGFYKHPASATGIELYSLSVTLVKTSTGAEWNAIGGVILAIDGTDADIAWVEFLSIHAEDTSSNTTYRNREAFPIPLDLTVSGGALSKIAAGFIETGITAINTGITLNDIEGVARTPAVGDIVTKATKISGGGTATLHASIWYKGVV